MIENIGIKGNRVISKEVVRNNISSFFLNNFLYFSLPLRLNTSSNFNQINALQLPLINSFSTLKLST